MKLNRQHSYEKLLLALPVTSHSTLQGIISIPLNYILRMGIEYQMTGSTLDIFEYFYCFSYTPSKELFQSHLKLIKKKL